MLTFRPLYLTGFLDRSICANSRSRGSAQPHFAQVAPSFFDSRHSATIRRAIVRQSLHFDCKPLASRRDKLNLLESSTDLHTAHCFVRAVIAIVGFSLAFCFMHSRHVPRRPSTQLTSGEYLANGRTRLHCRHAFSFATSIFERFDWRRHDLHSLRFTKKLR